MFIYKEYKKYDVFSIIINNFIKKGTHPNLGGLKITNSFYNNKCFNPPKFGWVQDNNFFTINNPIKFYGVQDNKFFL